MIYKAEHPKPQFMRQSWENLNGEWDFEIDQANSGLARGLSRKDAVLTQKIQVPFCPESRLSGVGHTDFLNAVWYQRHFTLTKAQTEQTVTLHFGAVDYETHVFINGRECGMHRGGYVSFSFDISRFVEPGDNLLTVQAIDPVRDRMVPSGKQSVEFASSGCFYTRTTGIWQTVWLDFMPRVHLVSARYTTDIDAPCLHIEAQTCGSATLRAEAFYEGRPVGCAETRCSDGHGMLTVQLTEKHLWDVGQGRLYDLVLTYGEDRVESYFGLRVLELEGYRFKLNGHSVFQRLVLDQGFYPDGIYTAPHDSDLSEDIDRSLAMGFNGARLHEKVFEERFLYHCDRKGYLVWGEYPSWGLDHSLPEAVYGILPEWIEEVQRDFNHPAIVGWCPFNETWDQAGRKQDDRLLALVYQTTKALDGTRPCIDTSGNFHVITDIFDVHNYEQDPEQFAAFYERLPKDGTFRDQLGDRQHYRTGQPTFVSEYGGIRWTDEEAGWGYGNAPKTREEFLSRLKGLTDALLDDPCMLGLCYTQLTDVEQEQNGLYTYDRRPKFPPETIYPIFARRAAIEDPE